MKFPAPYIPTAAELAAEEKGFQLSLRKHFRDRRRIESAIDHLDSVAAVCRDRNQAKVIRFPAPYRPTDRAL